MRKNKEIWRDIEGYEGLYQVSNMGRVKSMPRKITRRLKGEITIDGAILKPNKIGSGYEQVTLYNHGERFNFLVHRLVAEAFIPNPHNYPEVNHKDEVKTNNSVDNLEWCDTKYNINYGGGIEKRSSKQRISVDKYSLTGEFIKHYKSLTDAELDGFNRRLIHRCCKGLQESHKGYNWRFGDD